MTTVLPPSAPTDFSEEQSSIKKPPKVLDALWGFSAVEIVFGITLFILEIICKCTSETTSFAFFLFITLPL